MKNIAVIGSGTMGNGIAHVFSQSEFSVSLIDVKKEALDKAYQTISSNLDRMIAKGSINEEKKASTLGLIEMHTSLAEGVKDCDLEIGRAHV